MSCLYNMIFEVLDWVKKMRETCRNHPALMLSQNCFMLPISDPNIEITIHCPNIGLRKSDVIVWLECSRSIVGPYVKQTSILEVGFELSMNNLIFSQLERSGGPKFGTKTSNNNKPWPNFGRRYVWATDRIVIPIILIMFVMFSSGCNIGFCIASHVGIVPKTSHISLNIAPKPPKYIHNASATSSINVPNVYRKHPPNFQHI